MVALLIIAILTVTLTYIMQQEIKELKARAERHNRAISNWAKRS